SSACAPPPPRCDLAVDPEDGMLGRDPKQLLVGGLGADPAEELVDLPLPLLQVGAQQRRSFLGRHLARLELLGAAAEDEAPAPGDAHVAHPLRLPARCDQIALALEDEQVDRGAAPLPALAPPDFEDARPGEAEPQPHRQVEQWVDDVPGYPAGFLKG